MLKKAVKLETPGTSASAIPSNTVNQHHIASQQQNSTVQAGTPGPYAAVAMASNSSAANVVSPPAARGYPMGVMPAAAASSSAHKSFVYVPPAPAAAAGSSSSVVPSKATNPAPIIPVPSAALPRPSAPAVTSAKKKKATKAPKPLPHPAHIYVPRAGDPPGLRERMLAVLCTPHKIDAYRVLKAVPGVSVMEVLTELAAHDNTETELDPDFLLFNIVARREVCTHVACKQIYCVYHFGLQTLILCTM